MSATAKLVCLDDQARPALARGVRLRDDPITNEPVLLFPEGFIPLDEATHDILARCSGQATVGSIIQALAEEYDADPAVVREDTLACLAQLRQQMLITLLP